MGSQQQQFLSEADLQKVFGGIQANPGTSTGLQGGTIDCEKTTSSECSAGSLIRK